MKVLVAEFILPLGGLVELGLLALEVCIGVWCLGAGVTLTSIG